MMCQVLTQEKTQIDVPPPFKSILMQNVDSTIEKFEPRKE